MACMRSPLWFGVTERAACCRGSHDPFTNSTKAFLPEVGPKASAKPWGRCAVMGNSGILNHNNQGAEISAHDTIIRINQVRPAWLPSSP